MGATARGEARRLNGWVVEDRGASARTAGSWLTSIGVLLAASGAMMLAMHRAWISMTTPGITALLLGAAVTAIGWSCLRRAEEHRARLLSPVRGTAPTWLRQPPTAGPYSPGGPRRRVELLPIAALQSGH